MSNLLNPKPAVFYLSIFPQFIPIHSNHMLMGTLLTTIHAVESMLFFTFLVLFVGTLKPFLLVHPLLATWSESQVSQSSALAASFFWKVPLSKGMG